MDLCSTDPTIFADVSGPPRSNRTSHRSASSPELSPPIRTGYPPSRTAPSTITPRTSDRLNHRTAPASARRSVGNDRCDVPPSTHRNPALAGLGETVDSDSRNGSRREVAIGSTPCASISSTTSPCPPRHSSDGRFCKGTRRISSSRRRDSESERVCGTSMSKIRLGANSLEQAGQRDAWRRALTPHSRHCFTNSSAPQSLQ